MIRERRKDIGLIEEYLAIGYMEEERRIRILLPKDYYKSQEAYPVIYMHDGQNIFFDRESYSGHSWRVIQTLKRNPNLAPMIIVAIDNSGTNRINEYTAWKLSSSPHRKENIQGGQGEEYGEFLVGRVKKFIDKNYRTKSQREYTGLCGSSLGASITSYMGIRYNHIFGNLGIFSLANWLIKDEFKAYMEGAYINLDQRIYIQVGTEEGDDIDRKLMRGNMQQAYIDSSLDYYRALIKKGIEVDRIKVEILAGAKHNEKAWAESLPSCLSFFAEKW